MALNATHPHYQKNSPDWTIVRDVYLGERHIKGKGEEYLKPTTGMIQDGFGKPNSIGQKTYDSYRQRAVWYDLFKNAIGAYIGMLHMKDAVIKLPEAMKNIKSNQQETPQQLLRRINEEQLTTGRLGLLVDMPRSDLLNTASPLPYIAMYYAEAVRNWDTGADQQRETNTNWIILDESGYARDSQDAFTWTQQTRYRVCQLGDVDSNGPGNYMTGLFETGGTGTPEYDPSVMITPSLRGKTLDFVPFTFVNSKDLLSDIDPAPLLGLANIMLALYRGEADYRWNLFMQGQDTLVTIGGIRRSDVTDPDAPLRVGAGSRIDIEANGDAKYIGVNSSGLSEQRVALDNMLARAEVRAGQLINSRVGDKESGDALRTRMAAQTATLQEIALSGAMALQTSLRSIATWMGLNPEEVVVTPNLEFGEFTLTGQDLFQMMGAKDLGAPIAYQSLHEYLNRRGMTTLTWEQELERIQGEKGLRDLFAKPEPPAPTPHNGPTNK